MAAAHTRSAGDRVTVDVLMPAGHEDRATTRRHLLGRAAAGGVVVFGGILVAGLPKLAVSAQSPAQDVEILNFALVLEHLQSRFYEEAAAAEILDGELREFVDVVGGHEQAHVEYLTDALGEQARPEPSFSFGDSLADADSFAAGAVALEDLAVAAYNGQAANLRPASLAAAATILSVDARHAAWIRSIVGKTPARQPTDRPLTGQQVEARIAELGFLEETP